VPSSQIRMKREYLRQRRKSWGTTLQNLPVEEWPPSMIGANHPPVKVMRSHDFLVQIFDEGDVLRMSVNRCAIDDDGNWRSNISWDELQRIKSEAGFGNWWAVEIFPSNCEVINVANMRHLWLLSDAPPFAWRKQAPRG
jgi:hypothetical protein